MSKEGDLSRASEKIREVLERTVQEELSRARPCSVLEFYIRVGQRVGNLALVEIERMRE